MELPAALFEDVTGSAPAAASEALLTPAAGGAGGAGGKAERDRRAAERIYLSRRALVAPVQGKVVETPRMGMLRDLSRTGLGLLHDRKMRVGQEFIIYLPRRHEGKPVPVRCAVAHCEKSGPRDGPFLIGASFVAVLDPEYAPPPAQPKAPTPAEVEQEVRRIQQAMFN